MERKPSSHNKSNSQHRRWQSGLQLQQQQQKQRRDRMSLYYHCGDTTVGNYPGGDRHIGGVVDFRDEYPNVPINMITNSLPKNPISNSHPHALIPKSKVIYTNININQFKKKQILNIYSDTDNDNNSNNNSNNNTKSNTNKNKNKSRRNKDNHLQYSANQWWERERAKEECRQKGRSKDKSTNFSRKEQVNTSRHKQWGNNSVNTTKPVLQTKKYQTQQQQPSDPYLNPIESSQRNSQEQSFIEHQNQVYPNSQAQPQSLSQSQPQPELSLSELDKARFMKYANVNICVGMMYSHLVGDRANKRPWDTKLRDSAHQYKYLDHHIQALYNNNQLHTQNRPQIMHVANNQTDSQMGNSKANQSNSTMSKQTDKKQQIKQKIKDRIKAQIQTLSKRNSFKLKKLGSNPPTLNLINHPSMLANFPPQIPSKHHYHKYSNTSDVIKKECSRSQNVSIIGASMGATGAAWKLEQNQDEEYGERSDLGWHGDGSRAKNVRKSVLLNQLAFKSRKVQSSLQKRVNLDNDSSFNPNMSTTYQSTKPPAPQSQKFVPNSTNSHYNSLKYAQTKQDPSKLNKGKQKISDPLCRRTMSTDIRIKNMVRRKISQAELLRKGNGGGKGNAEELEPWVISSMVEDEDCKF